jgi:hypothetical protein
LCKTFFLCCKFCAFIILYLVTILTYMKFVLWHCWRYENIDSIFSIEWSVRLLCSFADTRLTEGQLYFIFSYP